MVAVFGAAVAQGFWWWNSTVDVEGVELRSIWEVTDGGDSAYLYEVLASSKSGTLLLRRDQGEMAVL